MKNARRLVREPAERPAHDRLQAVLERPELEGLRALLGPPVEDWHEGVPVGMWRSRDGSVRFIEDMGDTHLSHCLRFAKTKPQHYSRLAALEAEQMRRDAIAKRKQCVVELGGNYW